jgi:hypothetical protein
VNVYLKKWAGWEERRERDIQKRSNDGVWYSAKGLLRAGKVEVSIMAPELARCESISRKRNW